MIAKNKNKQTNQTKTKTKTKLKHWHDVLIIWTRELKLTYFSLSVLNNTEMLSQWWTILRVSIIIKQEYRTCFFHFSTIDLWACSNSCLWSQWSRPNISSSVVPFSSCLQSFPASGAFPRSQFFASGGQSIGASDSASDLPMNIQDWFPLGLT